MSIFIRNLSVANEIITSIPTTEHVSAREGTPLAGIVKETCKTLTITNENKTSYIDDIVDLANGNNEHEMQIDALVSLGSQAVSSQFKIIRNDVRADIDEVFEWVEADVGDALSLKPDILICQSFLPDLFSHQLVMGAVDQYQQPNTSPIVMSYDDYPAMTQADLFNVMCAGDNALENALGDIVNLSEIDLVDIYDKNFRDRNVPNYPKAMEYIKPYYITFDLIESVIIFLIANGLNNNPIEGISVGLPEHRLAMAQMMRRYAYGTRYKLTAREVAVKNNEVYQTTIALEGGELVGIVVYKETYDAWLNGGGSVEVIIGLHIRRQLDRLSRLSPSEYDTFITEANRHNARREVLLKDKRSTVVSKAVAVAMERLLRDFDFELVPYTKEEGYSKFRKMVERYPYFDSMDVYDYVTKMVSVSLYDHLNAYRVIKAINQYGKENPNLSPREAAMLAKRDVVMDWLYSQVVVSK